MSIIKDSGRLAWLGMLLGSQRDKIAGLLRRLTGLGSPGALKPSLFAKFLHMLEEVAGARDQELDLINQIEAIEKKHRFLRKNHQLKDVKPTRAPIEMVVEGAPERPIRGWIWLLAFWYLMSRQRINQKKQGLTAD